MVNNVLSSCSAAPLSSDGSWVRWQIVLFEGATNYINIRYLFHTQLTAPFHPFLLVSFHFLFVLIHHQNRNILVSLTTLYTQLSKMQFFQLSALLAIVSVAAAQGNVTTISGTIISGAFSDLPTFSPSYFPSDALTDLIGGSASD